MASFQIVRVDEVGQLGNSVATVDGQWSPEGALLDYANNHSYGDELIKDGERFLVIALNTNGAHHTGALLTVVRKLAAPPPATTTPITFA